MDHPRISLEQWRALLAVVDAGGYAQAGTALHKSQSAVTYAVQKMEALLGVKAFKVAGPQGTADADGRGSLSPRQIVARGGGRAGGGGQAAWPPAGSRSCVWRWRSFFPPGCCCNVSRVSAKSGPQTHIELYETVLSGTEEALVQRRVDLAICSRIPPGFAGDALMRLRFIADGASRAPAASDRPRIDAAGSAQAPPSRDPRHGQPAPQRQLAGRGAGLDGEPQGHVDSCGRPGRWGSPGTRRRRCAANSSAASCGRCRCARAATRWGELYLVFADRDYAGPGALRLAEIIRERVAEQCKAQTP